MTVLPRLPWWGAVPVAGLGGFLLDVASPELAWWAVSFVGVALIVAALWQQRSGVAALSGLAAGAGFWLPHISWLTLYLGPVPWLGLSGLMMAWYVLFGVAAAFTTRGLARWRALAARPLLAGGLQAAAVAGLWVTREQVQGAWPYNGFPWGRLAHMQAEGPLLESVSWLGVAGLSGAVAFACGLVVAAGFARGSRLGARVGAGLLAAAMVAALALVPAATLPQTGSLTVAAVQGNSKSGIFDDRESGDVLDDHIAATNALLTELDADGRRVDAIVWPENSGEFALPDNVLGSSRVAALAERAGAPIILGAVLRDDDGSYTNSTLVWGQRGATGDRYDKAYPVPFAEYMPNRDFFHALAPDLVDLVQLDYTPGTRPAVLELATAAGTVPAGIAICFDIIFDAHAAEMIGRDAGVIFAQTNNADFGKTDENVQQLAITRLRAVESGRAIVNVSTVGTSEIIAPGGDVVASITPYVAGAMIGEVPVVSGLTPAMRVGAFVAGAWVALGLAGLASAAVAIVRARRVAWFEGD